MNTYMIFTNGGIRACIKGRAFFGLILLVKQHSCFGVGINRVGVNRVILKSCTKSFIPITIANSYKAFYS